MYMPPITSHDQSPALCPLPLLSLTFLVMPRATKKATMRAKKLTVAIMTYHTMCSSEAVDAETGGHNQGCQMAKFDPFLSLDCARVEGVGLGGATQGKEGIKFCCVAEP